jgi:hypothetical protein
MKAPEYHLNHNEDEPLAARDTLSVVNTLNTGNTQQGSAFICVLDAAGAHLLYSSLFGGTGNQSTGNGHSTYANGVAVDPAARAQSSRRKTAASGRVSLVHLLVSIIAGRNGMGREPGGSARPREPRRWLCGGSLPAQGCRRCVLAQGCRRCLLA